MPKEMTYNESTSTNEQEIANLFSDYFSSVNLTDKHTVLDVNKLDTYTFDLPNNTAFSVYEVYQFIKVIWCLIDWSRCPLRTFIIQIKINYYLSAMASIS